MIKGPTRLQNALDLLLTSIIPSRITRTHIVPSQISPQSSGTPDPNKYPSTEGPTGLDSRKTSTTLIMR
jgi:hypothetical protein